MPLTSPKRGAIPSHRSLLAAAVPHVPTVGIPANYIRLPPKISMWGNDVHGDCVTAEEAFAKACHEPEIFIPDGDVMDWASRHGVLEGAVIADVMTWMQTDGFTEGTAVFDDGPHYSVNWTNLAMLQSAIAAGPVKTGVAADQIETAWHRSGGRSGWVATGLEHDPNYDHCVSLCGYGSLGWLAMQLHVGLPPGTDPTKPGYAMFTWNSIGIIDVPSLLAVTCEAWLRQPTTVSVTVPPFSPVVRHADGIGGYDLKSVADRAFAFDYTHSGKLDHLALYRPGTGTMWILKHSGDRFEPAYHEGDPGHGIGGYDLKSPADLAFAFDYAHSGKLDHLVLYRPGTGTLWILKQEGGAFFPVYQQGDPGQGIGGYDLMSPADRAFAFDYEHSGKPDHLALYRPGTGTMWILKRTVSGFAPVYREGDPGHGIGGYDLRSTADRAFAFDFDHSGKLDHIALYRPGTGTLWILRNEGGLFSPVYHEGDPGHGIGGYDLKSPADRAFAFDFEHSGKLDHIALYRPGTGTMWILKNAGGVFSPVFRQGDPGRGIGGYDLKSPADLAMAFDFNGSLKQDHLALYRPGTGTFWVVRHA